LHDIAGIGRAWRQDQLAIAVAQQFRRRHARGEDAQDQARGLVAQPQQQGGQQQIALQIVGGDRKRGLEVHRIERGTGQESAHLLEQDPRRHRQRLRARGGRDTAPRLDEQGVADQIAQLVEHMADGRLGHAQALCRLRDRALLEHRQQQLQQAPVQLRWIDFVHG
jgi:hypothetical protein